MSIDPDALSLADALALSAAAQAYATARGWRVSVAVADATGRIVSVQRGDGAMWFTAGIAESKARTCVMSDGPSETYADLRAKHPDVWQLMAEQMPFTPTTLRGGIPIREGDRLVGAIAVSGATSEEDVEAAENAVASWRAGRSG